MYSENTAKSILDEHFVAPATAKPNAHVSRMERMWRGRLQKLCRLRFENHNLPDDDDGRAMLTALLRFGLTDEAAIEDAPWCGRAELATLKRLARRMKWRGVGELINLTFAEWKAARLYAMRPIDATEDEIQAWRDDQRRASSRKSKAKSRAREAKLKRTMQTKADMESNPRHTAILEMLIANDGWMSVPALMEEARKLHAFTRSRYRNTTWCSGPPANAIVRNLRDAVHEALNQLQRKGVIGTDTRPGKRGPVRWARLEQSFISDTASERRSVGDDFRAKRAENQSVSGKINMSARPKKEGARTSVSRQCGASRNAGLTGKAMSSSYDTGTEQAATSDRASQSNVVVQLSSYRTRQAA